MTTQPQEKLVCLTATYYLLLHGVTTIPGLAWLTATTQELSTWSEIILHGCVSSSALPITTLILSPRLIQYAGRCVLVALMGTTQQGQVSVFRNARLIQPDLVTRPVASTFVSQYAPSIFMEMRQVIDCVQIIVLLDILLKTMPPVFVSENANLELMVRTDGVTLIPLTVQPIPSQMILTTYVMDAVLFRLPGVIQQPSDVWHNVHSTLELDLWLIMLISVSDSVFWLAVTHTQRVLQQPILWLCGATIKPELAFLYATTSTPMSSHKHLILIVFV